MARPTPLRPSPLETQQMSGGLMPGVILVLAALLAYANSFPVPLLFDDWVTILHNPQLRQLWPIWAAFSPPEFTGVGGRPIANLSFVLNYAVTGESVPGFHAVNLAIHVTAGLALFGIVRRTLQREIVPLQLRDRAGAVALAVAALWLLHPVHTQSVTYVSQRTESLMGMFYFLTLYAFIRGATAARPVGWYAAAVGSCFAGMATKEGMVTVPVIVLLYDYAFLSGSFIAALRQRWLVYTGLALSWALLAFLLSGLHGRGVGFGLGMTWWSYLLIECGAIVRYLAITFWPAPLVFDYGTDLGNPAWPEIVAGLGLGALGVGTVFALWRAPAIGFLGAWFLITLAPTSSVVPIPLQPISENRIYVPTAAVLAGFVLLVQYAVPRRWLPALGMAALAFTVLTFARNRDYRSEIAIWSDTVAKRPTSARAHSNLGHALQTAGKLAEARQHHEIAIKLRPNYAEAHVNLAAILGQLGDTDRAIEHSQRATEIDPRNANAFFNLGVGLTQKGRIAEAINAYEAALRLNHNSGATQANLSLLLLSSGRVSESMVHSQAALQLNPGLVEARYSLACALAMTGRTEEGIVLLREVVQHKPTYVEAFQNLGTVLVQVGRPAEAIPAFESALRLNPNQPAAHFGLGNAKLALGLLPDAVASYQAAVGLSPQSADAHLNLGIAFGRLGRKEEAIASLETALRLNPQLAQAKDNLARLRAGAGLRSP